MRLGGAFILVSAISCYFEVTEKKIKIACWCIYDVYNCFLASSSEGERDVKRINKKRVHRKLEPIIANAMIAISIHIVTTKQS